jgi:hypothetical protein
MEFNGLSKLCSWEREKALYIIGVAEKIGMNLDSYGEIGVNNNSGYTYLWLEDYNFTLYMPINCELSKWHINALWTNMENGDEEEMTLGNSTLIDIEDWITECEINFANSKN